MNNIEKAQRMFLELESRRCESNEVAKRNFEIYSRLQLLKN